MTVNIKVAIVGPKKSGKTRIANELVGRQGSPDYDPTKGVRILETDRTMETKHNTERFQVEIWDTSGDQNYESCWPAITKDLDGLIVCFDPTSKAQANNVRIWCEWFCSNADLETNQAVIFAHGNLKSKHKPLNCKLSDKKTVKINIVNVNCDKKPGDTSGDTSANREFEDFLNKVYSYAQKRS